MRCRSTAGRGIWDGVRAALLVWALGAWTETGTLARAEAHQPGGQQPAPAAPPSAATGGEDAQKPPAAGEPDDQPTPPQVTATVTVFGEAEPGKVDVSRDVRSLPVHSSLLQAVEIARKTYREPGELLRSMPGVDFVHYGQGGIPSGPSVRGYTDRNFGQDIAGHLDGIPLNTFGFVASHGALDLTLLFPETIDRIELVRGPLDARYGDFNRGASVNFVTKDGMTRPAVSLAGGSFGSWRVTGSYGNHNPERRRVSVYSAIDGHATDGYSRNQGLEHFKSFHRLFIPFGRSDLSFSAMTFWSEWDAPSYIDIDLVKSGALGDREAVNPTDGGRQNTQLFYVRYRRDPKTVNELAATAYVSRHDWLRFRSDFLISPTQTQVRQIDERVKLGYRVEKSFGRQLFGRRSLLLVGSSLQRDDAETRQASTLERTVLRLTDDVPVTLTNFGLYAQQQWQATERLKVMGGLRYSHVDYGIEDNLRAPGTFVASYSASQVSPKVGVAFSPIRALELYTNVATGMRSPTPRTEVRNSIDSVGRVEIAETRSYEAGVRALLFERLDLHGNVWRADNTNEIRGIPPGGTQFESLGESRRDGGAFEARWFAGPVTRVFAAFSWVEARLLTPTTPAANRLPDIPGFVHQLGIESGIPLPSSRGALVATADLSFYGRKNLNTTGTRQSEPYERVTFRAIYEHRDRYRIWAGGFVYPGSRLGESAFLFGQRVGVRPNPRVSVDLGIAYSF